MPIESTLRLLLAYDNFEEANRVVSLLRNANYRVESKHASSEDELNKLLSSHSWDLALAHLGSLNTPVKTVIGKIRRESLDIPTIIINEEYDPSEVVDGLRMGAVDVVSMDSDQHLLLTVARTLFDREQRSELRKIQRQYADAEARCVRLLTTSVDAIAIIQEGMYLFTNDSYAELFGHIDSDAMLCMPVIDTVAGEDQDKLIPYLGLIEPEDDIPTTTINFMGVTQEEAPLPIEARIAKVKHEGEPALELLITRRFIEGKSAVEEEGLSRDPNAISIQRDKVLELISETIQQCSGDHNHASALLYITVDNFSHLQGELGIQKIELLIAALKKTLVEQSHDSHAIGRFREGVFVMVLPNTGADAALGVANSLCAAVRDHMFQVDNETFSLTLGIGVSVINATVPTAESCIERAQKVLKALYQEKNSTDHADGAKLAESGIGPEFAENNAEQAGRMLLNEKQFELYYQPIIPLHGEPAEYYEVLLQVKPQPEDSQLPENFIAEVFKTAAGIDIDRWVVLESIKTLSGKLQDAPNTQLFINLCGQTIGDESFVSWLKVAFKAAGISPRQLVFQLREIDVGRQYHRSVELIGELSGMNAEVALSHFGLSIEPMKLLKKLSVNFVKFDHVMIENAFASDEELPKLETLIEQLKSDEEKETKEQIIIPFVERADMIPTLWGFGAHYIQGHYLQQPSPEMSYDFSSDE